MVNTGEPVGGGESERELTINRMESPQGKRLQEILEVDIRIVQKEKIPPRTMREILVQANLRHKGIGLITPASGRDLDCIHPKTSSLMIKKSPSELEDKPMTEKQEEHDNPEAERPPQE